MHSSSGDPHRRPEALACAVEQDETRLIAEVSAGRLPAFDSLYRNYHPRLTAHFSDLGQSFQRDPGQRFKLIADSWRGVRVPT